MKKKDHVKLAHFLLQGTDSAHLLQHRKAFLVGCVEPDLNPFTYMRGSISHQILRGHNAENSRKHIEKCLAKLQNGGLNSTFSYFTLGTLIHYVADSFTYPHNTNFDGNMRSHVDYEKELHQVFATAVTKDFDFQKKNELNIRRYFEEAHDRYCTAVHDFETDCHYILTVCANLFEQFLAAAQITPAWA